MKISCWSFIFLKVLFVVFGVIWFQDEMVSAQGIDSESSQEFQLKIDKLSQDLSDAIIYEDADQLRGSWVETEKLLQQNLDLSKSEANNIFDLLCYTSTQNYEFTKLARLDGSKVVTYCENSLAAIENGSGYSSIAIQVATSYRLIDAHQTGIRKLKKMKSELRNKARLRRLGNIYNYPFKKRRRLFFAKEISEVEFALADLYSEINQHQKAIDSYQNGFNQITSDAIIFEQQAAEDRGTDSQIELDKIAYDVDSGFLLSEEQT